MSTLLQRRHPGPSPINRNESWGAELSTEAENPNRNVNWLGSKGTWLFYMFAILFVQFIVSFFVPAGTAWAITHLLHGVVRPSCWAAGHTITLRRAADHLLCLPLEQGIPSAGGPGRVQR